MTIKAILSPNTLVYDRYRIRDSLNRGGMGRTYLAIDEKNEDQPCVLKEFDPMSNDESVLQKCRELFHREAKVLQQLDHPQIPKCFNQFEEDGRLFLVQEYIQGKSYAEINHPLSESDVMQWLNDILPVLDYIHSNKVIHRDISPDNIIFCTEKSKPVLIDFGAVKQAITQIQNSPNNPHFSSLIGTQIGKIYYSSPEQSRGICSPKSDLYSLGMTAMVLLTAKNPQELLNESLQWEWEKYVNVSPKLTQILNKMVRENPTERYPTAQAVLDALNNPYFVTVKTELSTPTKNKAIALISLVSIGLIGGMSVVAPRVPILCKPLDNCLIDKQYYNLYQQYYNEGEQALKQAEKAHSIPELETASDRLQKTINNLETIPKDVKVYEQSKQAIANYKQQLNKLQTRIDTEKKAQKPRSPGNPNLPPPGEPLW